MTLRTIGRIGAVVLSLSPMALTPLVASAATTAPDYGAIDAYVSSSLAGTPGFALAIVHGDQVAHLKDSARPTVTVRRSHLIPRSSSAPKPSPSPRSR